MMKCFHGQAKITQPKHGVIYFVFILSLFRGFQISYKSPIRVRTAIRARGVSH